jgi:hypothetical protein
METLKLLHASVAQTFEHSFDNAYRDLNATLALRDTKVAAAEEKAKLAEDARRKASAEIEQLKVENTQLREELCRGDIGSGDAEVSVSESQLEETYAPRHVLGLYDYNDSSDTKYDMMDMRSINGKYAALYGDAQTLVKAYKGLRKQIKRHKRKLEHWSKCLERDEFVLVLNGALVKFQRVKNTTCGDAEHSPVAESISATDTSVAGATAVALGSPRPELDEVCTSSVHGEDEAIKNSSRESLQTESLQAYSTQSNDSFGAEEVDSSNTRERQTLKRKRGILLEPRGPAYRNGLVSRERKQPIVVKSESMSSNPLPNISNYKEPVGTQDLDEVGSTVETPKKGTIDTYAASQIGSSVTIQLPPTRKLVPQDHDSQHFASGQRLLNPSTVLQPVDGNVRVVHGSAQWSKNKSAISPRKAVNHDISSIAEDGEKRCPLGPMRRAVRNANIRPLPAASNTGDVSSRLQDLLEGPLPSKRLLQSQRSTTETSRDFKRHRQHNLDANQEAEALAMDNTHLSNASAEMLELPQANRRLIMRKDLTQIHTPEVGTTDSWEIQPEEEPYRARPLHRLDLSHFKINPEYNGGLEYAFDTVVRKKDERKCIKSCSRPGCCGEKFLAMARLGGLRTDTITACQEEDQKILEDYLGEEKHLLDGLGEKDRQGLLNEARAGLIADRFGKHRNHHQRPTTPPGFWRTDMPDTQELERDHEEARRLERAKVKERYREAMRPGGLWKYADE